MRNKFKGLAEEFRIDISIESHLKSPRIGIGEQRRKFVHTVIHYKRKVVILSDDRRCSGRSPDACPYEQTLQCLFIAICRRKEETVISLEEPLLERTYMQPVIEHVAAPCRHRFQRSTHARKALLQHKVGLRDILEPVDKFTFEVILGNLEEVPCRHHIIPKFIQRLVLICIVLLEHP